MYQIAKRLMPGKDVKKEIIELTKKHKIKAGCIVSAVGSLSVATLRTAASNGKETIKKWTKHFEIVSMTGTISKNMPHIHLSISDIDGKTYGGHLKEGCLIYTTVELIILVFEDIVFTKEFDKHTGFKELKINKK